MTSTPTHKITRPHATPSGTVKRPMAHTQGGGVPKRSVPPDRLITGVINIIKGSHKQAKKDTAPPNLSKSKLKAIARSMRKL